MSQKSRKFTGNFVCKFSQTAFKWKGINNWIGIKNKVSQNQDKNKMSNILWESRVETSVLVDIEWNWNCRIENSSKVWICVREWPLLLLPKCKQQRQEVRKRKCESCNGHGQGFVDIFSKILSWETQYIKISQSLFRIIHRPKFLGSRLNQTEHGLRKDYILPVHNGYTNSSCAR
jgi:hypothetical protein